MIQEFLPSEWNSDMTHQLRRNHFTSSVPLNGANVQENVIGVLANTENEFYCFLSICNQDTENQKKCIRLVPETPVVALDPSMSNEPHHQFLDL